MRPSVNSLSLKKQVGRCSREACSKRKDLCRYYLTRNVRVALPAAAPRGGSVRAQASRARGGGGSGGRQLGSGPINLSAPLSLIVRACQGRTREARRRDPRTADELKRSISRTLQTAILYISVICVRRRVIDANWSPINFNLVMSN